MKEYGQEIKALNARIKELQMHELLRRILQNHCFTFSDKKYYFERKRVHDGKYKLKAMKNWQSVKYWYVEYQGDLLRISHGNTEKELKDFFKTYQKQFER